MSVSRKAVGATGRRRIVPMLGIDFIAGDIKRKDAYEGNRYGGIKPNIGGRTRSWSNINFLQVNANPNSIHEVPPSASQMSQHTRFRNCRLSALATSMDLMVLTQVQQDWGNNVTRAGKSPDNYATFMGWLMAVRMSQAASGVNVTPTYTDWTWT